MAERPLVKFTLNGRTLEAREGTLVIDAAKAASIHIPHYCYHPGLGNPGVCRLCICEVEGAPKPQVSCRVPVKAGMVVKSDSPKALAAQQSSLEFHLQNHPLDCPVCDQAGECWLQDYYMSHGLYTSAVREDKRHKEKAVQIGPMVMLDQERCILCTRCTRFLDQVTHTNELGIFHRGDRDVLAPYPGRQVDNPYASNIIDICPVGALTDKDFRFKVRVWYLTETPSICTACARNCAIDVHANLKRPWHTPDARVARFKPRYNPEVNGWWMCDEGRYSYKEIDSRLRLRFASVLAEDGRPEHVAPAEAAKAAARALSALVRERGAGGLAVVLSGTLSNEDAFAARRLFAETLKAVRFLTLPGPDQLGTEDDLLRRKEKVPNLAGLAALGFGGRIPETSWTELAADIDAGRVWGLFVVDRDPVAVWGEGAQKTLERLSYTVYQGTHANRFSTVAHWVLPACSFAEEDATFTNFQGQVQRANVAAPPLGESRPDWLVFADMLGELGSAAPRVWAAAPRVWAAAPWETPAQVFAELARAEPAFSKMSFDGLGPHGKRLGEAAQRPALAKT